MDDKHGVELESHGWPRLNVADARKEQRRQALTVREAFSNSGPNLLEKLRSRRVFDEANERFDGAIEPHDSGIDPNLRSRNGVQTCQKRELTVPEHRARASL